MTDISDKLKVLHILNEWIANQDDDFSFENRYRSEPALTRSRCEMAIKDSMGFLERGIDIPPRWGSILNKLMEIYKEQHGYYE